MEQKIKGGGAQYVWRDVGFGFFFFRGHTRDRIASWKQEQDAGILITSGSGISHFWGDGIRES